MPSSNLVRSDHIRATIISGQPLHSGNLHIGTTITFGQPLHPGNHYIRATYFRFLIPNWSDQIIFGQPLHPGNHYIRATFTLGQISYSGNHYIRATFTLGQLVWFSRAETTSKDPESIMLTEVTSIVIVITQVPIACLIQSCWPCTEKWKSLLWWSWTEGHHNRQFHFSVQALVRAGFIARIKISSCESSLCKG